MQPKERFPVARPPLVGWNIALLLALLAGCAVLPPPATFPNRPQQAETAARKGNHAQAAQLYEAAAAARAPSEQADLLLAAAREWLAAGSTVDGARVIGMLTASAAGLTPEQNFERTMLDAEVTLVGGHPAAAWQKISAVAEPTAAPAAPRYLQLRLRIALAAARPVDAVRAEISAERYSTSPAERTQLRSQLLAQLRQARERGVKLEPQASNDPVVRGWLDLAAVASDERGISLTGAGEAARWRARNPNHPATELLAQAFPPTLTAPAAAGTRVALLLPLSGPAAGAAGTIRDGFMSAYYQLPAASRPDLHIYDTAAVSATSAVAQARAEGSAFIVGPLTRADVAAVAGKPVGDIFTDDGEAAFRELERAAAQRALATPGAVVALGSGAVLDPGVQQLLPGQAVVYLEASFSAIARRLGLDRPRVVIPGNPRGRLRSMLEERRPVYERLASFTVPADDLAPEEIADDVATWLGQR